MRHAGNATVAGHENALTFLTSVPPGMLIGGSWVAATSGTTMAVEDPATGEVIASVPDASPRDAAEAARHVVEAQRTWSSTSPEERSEILRRAFERMTERAEELACLVTLENGKPLAEARAEVAYAAEFFRWFSHQAVAPGGDFGRPPSGSGRILVMRQPVGPALLITPWNFPLAMLTRKIGPAIAAGCTMIVKPAPETPLSALVLGSLLISVGLPAETLSIITTSHADTVVEAILKEPGIRKISFTGSTEVGRLLLHRAADRVLRTSMELGGNAPFIVFSDADLELAVEGAMVAKMRNGGESCIAANRMYVQRSVAAEFSSRLADRMRRLRVGHGLDADVEVGPLINAEGKAKVEALVDDMLHRGGSLLVGGTRMTGKGYFFAPTVITDVPPQSRVLHEEIFGPVAPIISFDDEAEAIALANATPFGLAAYAFTRDLGRAMRVSESLEAGMVGINTGLISTPAAPFGGSKQSGLGREGGDQGMSEYLETKYVRVNW